MPLTRSVNKAFPILLVLSQKLKNKQVRKELLKDKNIIHALSELTLNILKGYVPLTPGDRQKLQKLRANLQKLVATETPIRKKYNLLVDQKGSGVFLSTLLSIGIPILTKLIKNARNGK